MVGWFKTFSPTTRLYLGRIPRLTSGNFLGTATPRQSAETMTSASAGHMIRRRKRKRRRRRRKKRKKMKKTSNVIYFIIIIIIINNKNNIKKNTMVLLRLRQTAQPSSDRLTHHSKLNSYFRALQ